MPDLRRLLPDTATIDDGALRIDGVAAADLLAAYGSPLVVYDAATVHDHARAYTGAARGALVVYGTKAFPNVALMRLLAEDGIGADVSTLGELTFALAAGMGGDRLVVHGNNKSDEELTAAARAGALVVVDSLEEVDRARDAGVERTLVRLTPGIDADTHAAIRTGHAGSKFGLSPDDALEAIRRNPFCTGLHTHIGSQLRDLGAARRSVGALAAFAARARDELDWQARILDLGGGLGVASAPEEAELAIPDFVGGLLDELDVALDRHRLPSAELVLEPGRSLVARAGVTLYRVGSVKHAGDARTYVAVDGGMSDNPRPALYGARYTALLANRADEPNAGTFTVVGKHCESGDLLIDAVDLPHPRRGDILAVPATGGYTLAMGSNYNALPLPGVVLISGGEAQLIRRRQTIDDLLALET